MTRFGIGVALLMMGGQAFAGPTQGVTLKDDGVPEAAKGIHCPKDSAGSMFVEHHKGGEQRKLQGSCGDGAKYNGKWTAWYATGDVQWTTKFADGKIDGEFKSKFKNGKMRAKGKYAAGERVGDWSTWYDNGQVRWQVTYKGGKQEGCYFAYHRDGVKAEVGAYVGGAKVGKWTTYGEDGKKSGKDKHDGKGEKCK